MQQTSLSKQISRLTNKKTLTITTLLFTATIIALPTIQNTMTPETRTQSPDLSLTYTTTELYTMAETYGPEGRANYIKTRLTFDLIFPLIYAAFLATTISRLTRQTPEPLRNLNQLPATAALLDYLENTTTIIIMARYPAHTPIIDTAATLFTPTKWLTLTASFTALIIILLTLLYKRLK